MAEKAFERDELPFLQGPGEFVDIGPGEDTVPFGPVLVFAFVVLSALLGGEVESDKLAVVLERLCLCILSEAADEYDLVEHGVFAPFLLVWSARCGTCLPGGCGIATASKASGRDLWKGTTATSGGRSPHLQEAEIADHGKESVRPKCGTLNADRRI